MADEEKTSTENSHDPETTPEAGPPAEDSPEAPEAAGPPGDAFDGQDRSRSDDERGAESLQLEAEWMRASHQEGWMPHMSEHGAGHALSPYLCLYAGFFLGPPGLLLTALLVAPRRLSLRRAGIFVGIAGLAWSLAQGGTVLLLESWSGTALYIGRAVVNFIAGVALVITWRLEEPTTLLHSRQSVFNTIVIGLMQLGVYTVLSRDVLWLLGR